MQKNIIILPVFALILFSCSYVSKNKKKRNKIIHQSFVFDMKQMFTENENDITFPIWFNQGLIREKRIKQVTRKMYGSSKDSTIENLTPKEVRHYTFDTSGRVIDIQIEQFYEYISLGAVQFNYQNDQDEYGFSKPEVITGEENDLLEQFQLYAKIEYSEKYLVYKSEATGDYKFHMLFKEGWGALSLDSILSPTPADLVVLGPPGTPVNSFYMENTVNQAKKTSFKYSKKGHFLGFEKDNFPFAKSRTISYNDLGACVGFVDSTFNDNVFLLRRTSTFDFSDELPSRLVHARLSGVMGEPYREIETFQYTLFQD